MTDKKRTYAVDTRAALQVQLVTKPAAPGKQPLDSPQTGSGLKTGERQAVVIRLIDFFKEL
jgi:hypothetical protein